MNYWIKRRDNPQSGTYWVPLGRLTAKQARRHERAIYGSNSVQSFPSKRQYDIELERLRCNGELIIW